MNWFNADNTCVKSFHYVTYEKTLDLMGEHPTYTGIYYPTSINMRSSNYG